MKKYSHFVLLIFYIFQLLILNSCQIEMSRSLFNTSNQRSALFFSENDVGGFGNLTGNLQVGFASKTIYPQNPVSLSGFGSPLRRLLPPDIVNAGNGATYCKPYVTTDKDPRVKSLLFKGNSTDSYYLIVSIDVVAIPIDFNLKLMSLLQKNFPNQNFNHSTVQFIATHTHAGPAGLTENPFWAITVCDSFNQSIFNIVSTQIISAVSDSLQNLTTIQSIDTSIGNISGYNSTRFAGMQVDTSSYYINFKDFNSNSIGCFQVFSGHPTWHGLTDLTFSSDFAGYVEYQLQNQIGANTCIFFNATVGNATVATPPEKDVFVRNFVSEALKNIVQNQAAPTNFSYGTVFITLPGFQINYDGCGIDLGFIPTNVFQDLFSIKTSDITNNITKLSWFSIAGTYFFMFPGEPLYDSKLLMQSLLAQHFPNITSFFTLSTANDYVGYLMTANNYSTKNMDTCSTMHGPDTSISIINGFLSGLHQAGI